MMYINILPVPGSTTTYYQVYCSSIIYDYHSPYSATGIRPTIVAYGIRITHQHSGYISFRMHDAIVEYGVKQYSHRYPYTTASAYPDMLRKSHSSLGGAE